MDGEVGGWVSGWVVEWLDGQTDRCIYQYIEWKLILLDELQVLLNVMRLSASSQMLNK